MENGLKRILKPGAVLTAEKLDASENSLANLLIKETQKQQAKVLELKRFNRRF